MIKKSNEYYFSTIYLAASLTTLCLGLSIYLFFRSLNIVLFQWLPKPAVLDTFFIPLQSSPFASFFLYNLPDALWFLSGVLLLRFMWFTNRKT